MADLLLMDDGLYFGLPDDVYHKVFALSNSGVKYRGTWVSPLPSNAHAGNTAQITANNKRLGLVTWRPFLFL